jgi:hypothetical protein
VRKLNVGGKRLVVLLAVLPGCSETTTKEHADEETPDDPGMFVEVALGNDHACARTDLGNLQCWHPPDVNVDFGQADPPDERFSTIVAKTYRTCGLTLAGDLECWGVHDGSTAHMDYGQTVSAAGPFTAVSTGYFQTCVIGEDHEVQCWGADPNPDATVTRPEVPALAISLAGGGVLIDEAGSIACWGLSYSGELDAPAGAFASITRGEYHACALDADGVAVCWGEGGYAYIDPPAGVRFQTLAAGWQATCGITQDGALQCWGGNEDSDYRLDIAGFEPPGNFVSVSLGGGGEACAVRDDGALMCWGSTMEWEDYMPLPTVDDPAYADR